MPSICVKLSPENKLILKCACLVYGVTQQELVNSLIDDLSLDICVSDMMEKLKKEGQ